MPGTLFVVATPLGNLEDLSPRAARILAEADLIACEDTRRTRKLLNYFSIQTPSTSYHEHNERSKTSKLIALLRQGKQIALVSDAGTPLLSDPGYRLVHACREEKIPVHPVPGPSAAITALSVSGLPTDRFFFVGFLSRRAALQGRQLQEISQLDSTLLLYLSPHGLLPTLRRILEVLGNRRVFLIREMTKVHESHYFGRLQEILKALEKETPRGEYTLVIEGLSGHKKSSSELDAAAYVTGLMKLRGLTQKEAIKAASQELGIPKREIYKKMTNVE
ncbi:MAG: 16S rRNA (cytidine(1402)-2'-O)-methyltransferase [Acidobacteriota bacterium]